MGIIAGIFSKELVPQIGEQLINMIKSQVHRDSSLPLTVIDENIAFGMANEHDSIFCVKGGLHNSNISYNTDDRRIYSFVDGIVLDVIKHRQYFESIGVSIPIPTCSAIVAAAYKKWGEDFMEHLEGEFACIVWDKELEKVILVRDPFGHKPLHYYVDDRKLLISSEIKGIISANVRPEIDLVSLSDFLSLNNIPFPATLFKNIFQVPPGAIMVFSKDGVIRKHIYATHKFSIDRSLTFDEAVLQLNDRIRDAVRKRMIGNETFCFLSGGIDSSALISFASEISSNQVHAISIGFAEEEFNELEDAAIMAKHAGAAHHKILVSYGSFLSMLDAIVYHHDLPFTDTSSYPTFYAAKLARGFTNLILTGDGPDQTMGGSGHHVFAIRDNTFAKRNTALQIANRLASDMAGKFHNGPNSGNFSKIQRKLYRDSVSPVHAAYDLRSYFPDIVKKFICSHELWAIHQEHNPYRHPEAWFKEVEEEDDINKYLFADVKFYVPDDLMVKVDRMCMANGLETLSPFQDVKLSHFLNKLPGHYKLKVSGNGEITTKYILKEVCRGRVPKHTLAKKKQGFGIPLEKWLKQDPQYIRDLLFDKKSLHRGYFKPKAIKDFVNVFLSGDGDYFYPSPHGIVALLSLELWHRKYVD